jgi:hypothetical protein
MNSSCSTLSAAGARHLYAGGQLHVAAGQLHDLVGHGGGEQHGLPFLRHRGHYLLYLRGEAHVEHAVGLVEHQHLHGGKVHGALAQMVYQAARGGYHHVGVPAQFLHLAVNALAAYYHGGPHPHGRGELLHHRGHLQRQFAGGHQHQALAALGGQLLYHGYGESYGLAGAGLGYAHHVLAFGSGRYGLLLYGRGRGELERVEHRKEFGGYAEAVEARGGGLCRIGHIPLSHIWSAADSSIIY